MVVNVATSAYRRSAPFFRSSSSAKGDSPDPPQVGHGSTWVPVVVMLIVLPPPHRQHLAMICPPPRARFCAQPGTSASQVDGQIS
jgi:hypothetical protein